MRIRRTDPVDDLNQLDGTQPPSGPGEEGSGRAGGWFRFLGCCGLVITVGVSGGNVAARAMWLVGPGGASNAMRRRSDTGEWGRHEATSEDSGVCRAWQGRSNGSGRSRDDRMADALLRVAPNLCPHPTNFRTTPRTVHRAAGGVDMNLQLRTLTAAHIGSVTPAPKTRTRRSSSAVQCGWKLRGRRVHKGYGRGANAR